MCIYLARFKKAKKINMAANRYMTRAHNASATGRTAAHKDARGCVLLLRPINCAHHLLGF